MDISVIIPVYNASKTICATVESVLGQTLPPREILILDDGSTDDTYDLLQSYLPRITLFREANQGVAKGRNFLCNKAIGSVIAFLDHDDLWHPQYLKTQSILLKEYPDAVASFSGHVNFKGYGTYTWDQQPIDVRLTTEVIQPCKFIERYNYCPGPFGSMSFVAIQSKVIRELAPEPFLPQLAGADDFYLMNILPHYGPIIFCKAELVAYRETPGSVSSNLLKSVGLAVDAYEILEKRYCTIYGKSYAKVLRAASTSKRRLYAKCLMGIGEKRKARRQLRSSLKSAQSILSGAKTLALLLATYFPAATQPRWPAAQRK